MEKRVGAGEDTRPFVIVYKYALFVRAAAGSYGDGAEQALDTGALIVVDLDPSDLYVLRCGNT